MIDQPPTRKNEPIYRPPYESPIEDDFAYNAVRSLSQGGQTCTATANANILRYFPSRLFDRSGKRRVAVECDGKAFHRTARDLARDTLILGSYAVDTIFRLQGSNIYYRIGDCLFLLSRYAPELFTDRGLANLETLAAPETRAQGDVRANPFVSVEHCVIDNEERGIFHDPDDVPWTALFRAHSLRPTNFYHYMFKEFWDIVRYKKLNSLVAVQNMLGDPIRLIDKHFAWLDTLGIIGRRNYEITIETRQRELYPPSCG